MATEEMHTKLKKTSSQVWELVFYMSGSWDIFISHLWYSVQKVGNFIFAPIWMKFLMNHNKVTKNNLKMSCCWEICFIDHFNMNNIKYYHLKTCIFWQYPSIRANGFKIWSTITLYGFMKEIWKFIIQIRYFTVKTRNYL